MPQIYDVLKAEHREMQQLLEKMTTGKPDGKMLGQLTTMLTAHQTAEEKVVYPDLLEPEATHETTLEGIEEHHVAELILKELQKTEPKDERFAAKLSVLQENVNHHIQEEEKKLFPAAKKAMDKQWAMLAGQRFEEQEQALKQKMSAKAAPAKKTAVKRAAAAKKK